MHTFFEFMLTNAVVATLLALGVAVISRFGFRPAFLHLLWVLVLVRLVTPSLFSWPVTVNRTVERQPIRIVTDDNPRLIDESRATAALVAIEREPLPPSTSDSRKMTVSTTSSDEVNEAVKPSNSEATPAPSYSGTAPSETSPSETVPPGRVSPSERRSSLAVAGSAGIDLALLLGVTWTLGSLGCVLLMLVRCRRFHWALRHAEAAPKHVVTQANRMAQQVGLRRSPRVVMVEDVVSPMVWPIGRATIILPEALVNRLTFDELSMLIGHELAHLRRRDHWVRFLEMAATACFWWLPTVWWVRSRLHRDEEICCDAWVAQTWPHGVADYSRALLEAARILTQPNVVSPASGISAFQSLKRRLFALAENPPPHRLSSPLGIVLIIGACVVIGNGFSLQRKDVLAQQPAPRQRPTELQSLDAPVDPDQLPIRCDPLSQVLSPDGQKLALVGRVLSATDRNHGLFVIELESGAVHHLVKKALKTSVAWSPDSKRIAFANAGGYVTRYPLDIVDVETGAITPTGILGHMPDWSADGREIACLVDRTRADGVPDGRVGVWNVQTQTLRKVSPQGFNVSLPSGSRYVAGAYAPKWSPDGQHIAFLQYNDRTIDGESLSRRDAWVVDANGENLRLVKRDAESRGIVWSADSRSVSLDAQKAAVEIAALEVVGSEAWEKPPSTLQRELNAEQAAARRAAEYDIEPILSANRSWAKPNYGHLESIQFTHRMSPTRLDERFSWRRDGTWSVEVLHREDDQAESEIGRLWLTTGDNEQYTLLPNNRYARKSTVESLKATQERFGHLMGTRFNFVASDWVRTPQLFRLTDARPADAVGQTILQLKLNYGVARRYYLNFGAMFHSTSWGYLHHLLVQRAELLIDDATGRILNETAYTSHGITRITVGDWIEHEGKSFPGSIRFANADKEFTADHEFEVLPSGVWLLKSGTSQFDGKEPQREELVDVEINAKSPDVERHLTRIHAGLAELNQATQTNQVKFDSNLLRLGQPEPLTWTGTDAAAKSMRSLLFTCAARGERFREVPARPSVRARLRFEDSQQPVAGDKPLLLILYDDAGHPVQAHALPIAALDTMRRPATDLLTRIRSRSRLWLDPDLETLPKVEYTFHSNKGAQADYAIQKPGNVHYERGVTMTTALDSFVESPEKYRMPVYFTAQWNGRPVEVAVIMGPRFGWVVGNGIEHGWSGGYSVSAIEIATVVIDKQTGVPLMERYGTTEMHFLDYVEPQPGQFVPRRIVFRRVDDKPWGIDFRFQVLDDRVWLFDRSSPAKPEYTVWIDGVTLDGETPTSISRAAAPTDSPVETMDWSRVTDRSVDERAPAFDRLMAELVDFESSPMFAALTRTQVVEPGQIEFDLGRSSFLKQVSSWTLTRTSGDTVTSAATPSRVSRTTASVSFSDNTRHILNANAGDSKTQLRSVDLRQEGESASAKIELISQAHFSEQSTAITGVILNSDGMPIAAASQSSIYRVTQPIYQNDQLGLNFGDVSHAQNELVAVFGIQSEAIGGPAGSFWARYIPQTPVLPFEDLLSNTNPSIWTVGLTELLRLHRNDIARAYEDRRGDRRRRNLALALAAHRDSFNRLFTEGKEPAGLALLCRLAGHSGDSSYVDQISPLLTHPSEAVQDSAAIGLGLLGDGRALDRIREVAKREPSSNRSIVDISKDAANAMSVLGAAEN